VAVSSAGLPFVTGSLDLEL